MNRHPAVAAAWALLWLWLGTGQAIARESLTQLVKRIQPAVVTVVAYDAQGRVKGQGSGFFINQQGHFLTNHHVLTGAARAEVRTREGRRYPMTRFLAQDQAGDLVVAAIEPPRVNLPSLKISGVLPEVGEKVLVVGSPFELEQTLSDGVVSAVRRIPDLGTILQITAPISSGSSGSPVVNMKGEVIGIATFIFKEGQNLNFAVPGSRALALQQRAVRTPGYPGPVEAEIPTTPRRPFVAETKPSHPSQKSAGRAWVLLGQADKFYEAGEYERAAEAYKEAIRLKPDFALAHYCLGLSYGNLGRHQEAAAAFKVAIRLKPDFAEAHSGLGLSYLLIGDRGAALEEYKILKTLDPKMAKALFDVIYK